MSTFRLAPWTTSTRWGRAVTIQLFAVLLFVACGRLCCSITHATTQDAFVAYLTALAAGDDAAKDTQLAILSAAAPDAAVGEKKASKPKSTKPKRSVEEILSSGREDGFSTLAAPELKELLKAKKGSVARACGFTFEF